MDFVHPPRRIRLGQNPERKILYRNSDQMEYELKIRHAGSNLE